MSPTVSAWLNLGVLGPIQASPRTGGNLDCDHVAGVGCVQASPPQYQSDPDARIAHSLHQRSEPDPPSVGTRGPITGPKVTFHTSSSIGSPSPSTLSVTETGTPSASRKSHLATSCV